MEKEREKKIDTLFVTALNNNVFPGAAMAFSKRTENGYKRLEKYYGLAQNKPSKIKLTKDHFFDLASLTKPLTTVPLLLTLFKKKLLTPETQLGKIYTDCPSDKKSITIRQLMSHSAGFVAHREYFKELIFLPKENIKEVLLNKIMGETITSIKGDKHCYSDLGFMLLGLIIEKLTGKEIGELAHLSIYRPLELQNDLVFPSFDKTRGNSYVSTEMCLWDKKMLSGKVHDDNCRVMGGQAGHAGLFGTLRGVMGLCEQLLDQWQGRRYHPGYSNSLLRNSLTRVGNSAWTMGFDMVSERGSSSGSHFSGTSVGHLGFTGTSFWIDPEKSCIAVLLTNRVHYGRDNWKIKEFRPAFHDLLMGAADLRKKD